MKGPAAGIVLGPPAECAGREQAIAIDTPVTINSDEANWRPVADFEFDHDAAGLGWTRAGLIRRTMAAHVELTLVPIEL